MSKLNRDQISALLQEDDDESMESGTDFSDESDDIYSPELDKTTGNDDSSSDSEETGLSDENGGINDRPARGTIAVKWQDVKEVMLLSNCHTSEMCTVRRKMKDGTEAEFPCPDIVKTYRATMGGVDLADQMSGLYDISRKSNKWWKKVFYRGMMMAAVNTWVIYSGLNRKKPAFLPVLVEIAESLIEKGKESTAYK
ncbi:piggyBac transposable element-derived protein 3-like [Anastrepha obliqua]|uniref:piggyBac transposable element-derived protein 3-like n=1 Tax=Anastrepha obliqua TaxID=95512 RepID=UPI00240A15CC|nr:piggyBac transposable element-derived protein 3-like [Anastrepha obliqua]